MFMDPGRTQWDLNFRLLGIPVRVHPMFWLVSVIMGQPALNRGIEYLALWVGCLFISILIHEIGHVVMGRVFGNEGEIILYGFGGLAVGASGLASRWKRILVYLAGPGAGFLLCGVAYLIYLRLPFQQQAHPLAAEAIEDLVRINLFWGAVNLLPIWPLDGGRISYDLLTGIMPRRGGSIAFGISMTVAGLVTVHSLLVMNGQYLIPYLPIGGLWSVLLFGSLAVGSFQALQEEQEKQRWVEDHRVTWEDDDQRGPW